MSERLIDESRFCFNENFFHRGEYGRFGGWPNSTSLLYRIRIKPELSSTSQMLFRSGCLSLQCERWVKIENDPQKRHAEDIFTEEITKLWKYLCIDSKTPILKQVSIDIILSNSPCSECAEKLITLKNYIHFGKTVNLDRRLIFCDMRIKIANFYKHYKQENTWKLIEMVLCQIDCSTTNPKVEWKLRYQYLLFDGDFEIIVTELKSISEGANL